MVKRIKVKPIIVRLTMVKLFIFIKLLMVKLSTIEINMAKEMMDNFNWFFHIGSWAIINFNIVNLTIVR